MANTLTHFTCHIHTGTHSIGNYIDKIPVASFSFPRVSSLCAGWANRVLAQEDVNSHWSKDWLLFEPSCTFLLAFFNPPHNWVGHQRWCSEFLSLSGVQRRSSTKACFSCGSHFSSYPPISLSPPGLAEAWSVVRGQRQESQHPFCPAWPSPDSRSSQATSFLPTGCWGFWGRGGTGEGGPLPPANTSNLPLFILPPPNRRDLHKSTVSSCKPFCQRNITLLFYFLCLFIYIFGWPRSLVAAHRIFF